MSTAYSMDLRARAITLLEAGELTREEISELLQISESTLYDWWSRHRNGVGIAPLPHAGGRTSELDRAVLAEVVARQNDLTLDEYADAYAVRTGRRYDRTYICRVLGQMKQRRKSQNPSRSRARSA